MSIAASPQLDMALVLASKYSLDPWEVHFAHYSWCLEGEVEVPTTTLTLLQARGSEFLERCQGEIYPRLGGTQYGALILYFQHTGDVARSRVLDKLKSALTGLDWKVFLEECRSEVLLGMLAPVLSEGTVHVIGKVVPSLHSSLTKSDIFSCYAEASFFSSPHPPEKRWTAVKSILQNITDPVSLLTRMALARSTDMTWDLRLEISERVPDVRRYLEKFTLPHSHPYLPVYLGCYGREDLRNMMLVAMVLDADIPVGDVVVLAPDTPPEELMDWVVSWLTGDRELPSEIQCTALETVSFLQNSILSI